MHSRLVSMQGGFFYVVILAIKLTVLFLVSLLLILRVIQNSKISF